MNARLIRDFRAGLRYIGRIHHVGGVTFCAAMPNPGAYLTRRRVCEHILRDLRTVGGVQPDSSRPETPCASAR